DIRGAKDILLNIASGNREITMDEIFEVTEYVQEEAGNDTNLIWGNCYDESLGDKICVTVIATGFERKKQIQESPKVAVQAEEVVKEVRPAVQKHERMPEIEFEMPQVSGSSVIFEKQAPSSMEDIAK